MPLPTQEIECDILVVGGGLGGCADRADPVTRADLARALADRRLGASGESPPQAT